MIFDLLESCVQYGVRSTYICIGLLSRLIPKISFLLSLFFLSFFPIFMLTVNSVIIITLTEKFYQIISNHFNHVHCQRSYFILQYMYMYMHAHTFILTYYIHELSNGQDETRCFLHLIFIPPSRLPQATTGYS